MKTSKLTESRAETFIKQASKAIEKKLGLKNSNNLSDKGNEFYNYTLYELAKESLLIAGESELPIGKDILVSQALTHKSGIFQKLLADVAYKFLQKGYSQHNEIFESFTSKGIFTRFRSISGMKVNGNTPANELPESFEYNYSSNLTVSRQAIINNDFSVITEVPQKMGQAVRKFVGDMVFRVFNDNCIMDDKRKACLARSYIL